MTYKILITDTDEEYKCRDNQSLLLGMEALGRKGIPVGCRGGGCGVCKVEIIRGEYAKRPMSRDHISQEEEDRGVVLACRVRPMSDIALKVVGQMRKNVVKTGEEKHHGNDRSSAPRACTDSSARPG